MRRLGVLALVCASGAACNAYTLAPAGRHTIGDFYSFESSIPWSKTVKDGAELWTVDGPGLEALRFTRGVADGKPLFVLPGKDAQQLVYRDSMSETEIAELVVDTLSREGAGSVKSGDLRPAQFGTVPGFQFQLEYLTADGLESRGLVSAAVANKKLYLILYCAAKQHYFDRYAGEVQQILASIRVQ